MILGSAGPVMPNIFSPVDHFEKKIIFERTTKYKVYQVLFGKCLGLENVMSVVTKAVNCVLVGLLVDSLKVFFPKWEPSTE